MVFNSISFVLFFVLVLSLYWGVFSKRLKLQNLFLLIASYLFYGWWDWRFLGLILLSSITDYLIGIGIHQATSPSGKRILLITSLSVNLGILAFFKYFNFFIGAFAELLQTLGFQPHVPVLNIILPVGISFYTFQTLSYTIDIYRGKVQPTRAIVPFFTFVAFFPQLVAGPIERAGHLLPQFLRERQISYPLAVSGCRLMLWGMFKKVVIADRLAFIVDPVFAAPQDWQGPTIWLATIAFAIQIYCDFSGYSDIAVGTARLLGFDLMTNFRTPYLAASFREFWQRWHISLSTWFRDYVYIPLGGSRVNTARLTGNLLITFVISGFWHGANWTFLWWGLWHGLLVSLEFLNHRLDFIHFRLPRWLSIPLVFIFICIGWVFFRAQSIEEALLLLYHSTTLSGPSISYLWWHAFQSIPQAASWAVMLALFALLEIQIGRKPPEYYADQLPRAVRWVLYYVLIGAILFLGQYDNAPTFIYFQF